MSNVNMVINNVTSAKSPATAFLHISFLSSSQSSMKEERHIQRLSTSPVADNEGSDTNACLAPWPGVGHVKGIPNPSQVAANIDKIAGNTAGCKNLPHLTSLSPRLKDYRLIRVIGSGSFGDVYLAQHTGGADPTMKQSSFVALKVVPRSNLKHSGSYDLEKDLYKERDLLRRLSDEGIPCVTQLIESFVDCHNFYLVFELLPGGTLSDELMRGQIPPVRVKSLMAEMVLAIGTLHERKILHADLKPDNILFDSRGHIVLADFGLSRDFSTSRQTGDDGMDDWEWTTTGGGTPGYMGPEVFLRLTRSYGSDVFALGVIFFQLLWGFSPFGGGSLAQIRKATLECKPFLPRGGGVARDVRDLLRRMLSFHEANRPSIEEIKAHRFFAKFDWTKIEQRRNYVDPNYVPRLDKSFFEGASDVSELFDRAALPHRLAANKGDCPSKDLLFECPRKEPIVNRPPFKAVKVPGPSRLKSGLKIIKHVVTNLKTPTALHRAPGQKAMTSTERKSIEDTRPNSRASEESKQKANVLPSTTHSGPIVLALPPSKRAAGSALGAEGQHGLSRDTSNVPLARTASNMADWSMVKTAVGVGLAITMGPLCESNIEADTRVPSVNGLDLGCHVPRIGGALLSDPKTQFDECFEGHLGYADFTSDEMDIGTFGAALRPSGAEINLAKYLDDDDDDDFQEEVDISSLDALEFLPTSGSSSSRTPSMLSLESRLPITPKGSLTLQGVVIDVPYKKPCRSLSGGDQSSRGVVIDIPYKGLGRMSCDGVLSSFGYKKVTSKARMPCNEANWIIPNEVCDR